MGNSLAHALLSPSGAYRWTECTPSVRFEQQFPDSSGDAAREGTLAHAIVELMLQRVTNKLTALQYQSALYDLLYSDLLPADGEGVRKQEFYCPSMQEHCEQYVTYVMEQYAESKATYGEAQLCIEYRLDISDWAPESFGTGDVGIGSRHKLKVIDYKYGKGVEVSVVDNAQMKVYALGWLREFDPVFDIEVVEMTIYQPRMDNIAVWSISVADLLVWANDVLKPKALLAWAGEGDYVPGNHCKFCRGKLHCKALADYNLELAVYEFSESNELTDDELSDIYRRKDLFINWINSIAEYMLKEALKRHKQWPGLKLVEGRSDRKYRDKDKVIKLLQSKGYEDDELFKKEIRGIGDMEDLLGGAKAFASMLGALVVKGVGKPALVLATDKRKEFSPANHAASDFDDPEDEDPEN